MAKEKRNGSMKEQMEGIAIAITPVKVEKEKRKKKAKGGKANKGIEALRKEAPEVVERMGYQEGGNMDSQMTMMMPTEEEPMMEEQEQDMMPDEQMEDDYLDFIIDQSLSPEEETTLMTRL